MNALSVDIKDILIASESLSFTFGSDLFIGREPEAPDNTVTIYDTPGAGRGSILSGSDGMHYPSVQIRIRNNHYKTGVELCESIIQELHGRNQEKWNGTVYFSILCQNGPHLLKWDDNERAIFITNFNVQRKKEE